MSRSSVGICALARAIGRIAFVVAFIAAGVFARAAAAELGATVENTASVNYIIGGTPLGVTTPPAIFTVEARRTPSTIEFFRIAPNASDGFITQLNGSDFAPAPGGAFSPVTGLTFAGGALVDLSGPLRIAPATAFYSGEPIVIRVIDEGQNGDPTRIETLVATVTSGTGDRITLRLYESGPDTGEFYAYFQSTSGVVTAGDAILSVAHNEELRATYIDPFDATEVSIDTALVDPFGRLFDSTTGELVSGVTVTLIDVATGEPAIVYGIDGVSNYPATITTGGTVTDSGGMTYTLSPGEFRFPLVAPSDYRLVLSDLGAYGAPSSVDAADVAGLQNAPFTLVDGSYLAAFTVDGTGDVSFDVPLDPISELVVTKQTSTQTAAVGDFIRYEVTVENIGANASLVVLRDDLPRGFRYRAGSARLNGGRADDPERSADGGTLLFGRTILAAGDSLTLAYVAEVAAGTPSGEAVNRAAAVNGAGEAVSNNAEAAVFIQEDLLRSRLTIVGRVAEGACNVDDPWPRRLSDGVGVAGVRLYMETGAYVVTDEDGLYHFEDVRPGTHVVQIDEATVPEGYEAVLCESNTRFAGTPTSQFVDAQGGSAWRVSFYLRRTGAAAASAGADGEDSPRTEADEYDIAWLNAQSPDAGFAYPGPEATPKNRSVHVGVKHPNYQKVKLLLNGEQVPIENFAGRDVSANRRVAITRWRGVDIHDGENLFVAVIADENGNEVQRIEHRVHFVTEIAHATFLEDQSRLVADGRTPAKIAVRLTDGAGRPVHAGRIVSVAIDPPYRARDTRRVEDAMPLVAPLASEAGVAAGEGGVAVIELEPTAETGRARLVIQLDDGRSQEITAYLRPELRDWIVVGLAEGTGSRVVTTGDNAPTPSGSDLIGDGRVAVFAKGTVKGDWLVTAAVDTDKERGDEDDELFDVIDPDARYPLYGDRSDQRFEAQSRYPLYLKAEKGAFQALLGDYDTGLTQSKLGKYARRMSGIRTVYEGDRFSFTGFVAETNMDFARDEIPADGTSGPFRLSSAPLVRNSEKIFVETRDRFRPDIVSAMRPMTRYLDYDIDFRTGEIIFRLPVPAAPDANAFNVIVAEYETSAPVERNLTYGGRAAHSFLDGRAEAGVTAIREEGNAAQPQAELIAGDFTIDLTDTTRARVEYARSWRRGDGPDENGSAFLAEIEHASGPVTARAYYSEADENFGLNQQSSAVTGARRYGAEASYKFHEFEMANGRMRGQRFIDARVYREENLNTGANRSVAEATLRQESNLTSGSAGLRGVVENPATGPRRRALLAISSLKHNFQKLGLTIRAAHERPIASDGESTIYPERTQVGFDQRITDWASLNVTHEIQSGDNAENINTIVGVTVEPWSGARVTAAADRLTQESGERIGATLGVDQQFQLSKRWTASVGVTRRQELSASGELRVEEDIIADQPISPLEANEEFTSLYTGLGYRGDLTTGSARFELRQSEEGKRYTGVAGAAREVGESLSFAGAARYEQYENRTLADGRRLDARFGAAWRPRGEGLIAFNRFDIKYDQTDGQFESWKAVNNLAVNAMLDERWQVSLNHGFKYAVLDDGLDRFDGVTQLLGLESRFDVTDWLDVGMRGMALYSHTSRTLEYSYGPSIGVSPADNIWFSIGWNINGFRDEDFMAAEFAQKGPFITLRIKFDQNTARGLLDAISPDRAGAGGAP